MKENYGGKQWAPRSGEQELITSPSHQTQPQSHLYLRVSSCHLSLMCNTCIFFSPKTAHFPLQSMPINAAHGRKGE